MGVGDGWTRNSLGSGGPLTNVPGVGASLGGVGFVLQSGLASRFEVVKELGRGAQAVLWLVRDRECGGEPRVLKVYLVQGGGLDLVALEMVREASRVGESGHGHLVELFEHGEVGGHVFEVMEHCSADSLARLVADEGPVLDVGLVVGVVREVAGALVFLHGLQADGRPVVHRDVKPANVLVRSRERLDLVLCDYGLSRALSQTVEFRSAGRTPLYAPPEAAHGVQSPAWDWWSLGVIVVEMCIGRHPFVSAGGLVDYEVLTGVAQVDLSGVGDDRLRLLCAGLLTRDPGDRWGGVEVGEWLAGGSPVVREVTSATGVGSDAEVWAGVVDGPAVQPFVLGGVAFSDPVLLAGALAGDWDRAREIVANTGEYRKDHQLLLGFLESAGLRDATVVLQSAGVDPDLRLVRFLCALDPACPPVFRGYDVSPAGLVGLGGQAAGGDEAAVEAVAALADLPVLSSYHSSDAALPLIDGIWAEESRQLDALLAQCDGDDDPRRELADQRDRLQGCLLQVVADTSPGSGNPYSVDSRAWGHLSRRAEEAKADSDARRIPWFDQIASSDNGFAAAQLLVVELKSYASAQVELAARRESTAQQVGGNYELTPEGLVFLGTRAAAGDSDAIQAISQLYTLRVLDSRHETDPDLALIGKYWTLETQELDELLAQRTGLDDPRGELVSQRARLQGELLRVIADISLESGQPHSRDSSNWSELGEACASAREDRAASTVRWFQDLADKWRRSRVPPLALSLLIVELRPRALSQAQERQSCAIREAKESFRSAILAATEEHFAARVGRGADGVQLAALKIPAVEGIGQLLTDDEAAASSVSSNHSVQSVRGRLLVRAVSAGLVRSEDALAISASGFISYAAWKCLQDHLRQAWSSTDVMGKPSRSGQAAQVPESWEAVQRESRLPVPLAANYSLTGRELPGVGGLYQLWEVVDLWSSIHRPLRLLKVYSPSLPPPTESSLEVLEHVRQLTAPRGEGHSCSWQLHEFGYFQGRWFEVVEYLDGLWDRRSPSIQSDHLELLRDLVRIVAGGRRLIEISTPGSGLVDEDDIYLDLRAESVRVRGRAPLNLALAGPGVLSALVAAGKNEEVASALRQAGFMAPEIASGEIGGPSDCFALGALVFRQVTGSSVFSEEDGELRDHDALMAQLGAHDWCRDLCGGLLQPSAGSRWGLPEVENWLSA